MSALIDWNTTGRIFVESLGAGVLVVTAFALGARLVAGAAPPADDHSPARGAGRGSGPGLGRGSAASYALAGLCFLVAAAAVGFGVYFTVDK